jgi:hypothetical protein
MQVTQSVGSQENVRVVLGKLDARITTVLLGLNLGAQFCLSQIINVDVGVNPSRDTDWILLAKAYSLNRVAVISDQATNLSGQVVRVVNFPL